MSPSETTKFTFSIDEDFIYDFNIDLDAKQFKTILMKIPKEKTLNLQDYVEDLTVEGEKVELNCFSK